MAWRRPCDLEKIHWGRVTHICVSKLTVIGSDNGLSPGRCQAIIWTNDGILLIQTLGTNFSEILGEIHSFLFSKMHLKMSSAKWRLYGLGLNELKFATDSFKSAQQHSVHFPAWYPFCLPHISKFTIGMVISSVSLACTIFNQSNGAKVKLL